MIARKNLIAFGLCAALLVAFATLSWTSWSEKGITVDEPVHFVSAWLTTRDGDYQTDPENPPLWKYWVMLPQMGRELKLDRATLYDQILPTDRFAFYRWAPDQLFEQNDGDAMIRRSRAAMLVIGIALGAAIAAFAWRTAGPVAGGVALVLFAFDPNFLAHAPLVKNDVIVSLCWLCATAGLWSMGKRARWSNLVLVCAACTVGVLSKFTGAFLLPLVVLVAVARAINRRGPNACGVFKAIGLTVIVAAVMFVGIWGAYGFRFSPSKDHPADTSLDRLIATVARNEWIADTGQFAASAPPQVIARWNEPLDVRILHGLHDAHLLPHAFVDGMLSTKASSMVRPAFLFGNFNFTGWWYYYPVVFLVKTPVATLIAFAIVAVLAARRGREDSPIGRWTRICLAISILLYVLISMTSSVNVGVRHLFPIYPLLYVATGCAAARLWSNRRARIGMFVLGFALMIETLVAFPNYIPFFNVAAGGSRGGVSILSDSNIDWGQDVPLLAGWQSAHPEELLQVGCFSVVDPAHYGIRSLPLPGGPSSAGTPHWPPRPGIVAVSATNLQGAYRMFWPRGEDLYAPFRGEKPIQVLGGSIYLYRVER